MAMADHFHESMTGAFVSVGMDGMIQECNPAEDALRYHLNLIQSITDNTAAAIFVTDEQGHITFMNAEVERMFGFTREELIGQLLHDRLHHHHPDGRVFPVSECRLSKIFTSGETIRNHVDVFFRKNGTPVHVSCSNGLLEVGGKRAGTVIVLHDITARMKAELALREARDDLERRVDERTAELAQANELLTAQITERSRAEEELRRQAALLRMTSDANIIWDFASGGVRYWNHGAERLYGFSAEEARGCVTHRLVVTDFPEGEAAFTATLVKEGTWRGELTQTTKTGHKVIVESHHQLLEQPDRQLLVLETNHDITARVALEGAILAAGERERVRLGQDLHDGLCQLLTAARLKADSLAARLAAHAPAEQTSARNLLNLLTQALDEGRRMARGLEPVEPLPEGLATALHNLADSTQQLFDVVCVCKIPTPVHLTDHTVATELFRIAQEAVNNAIKHSEAKSISLQLKREADRISLTMACDGKGFPKRPRTSGTGLKTMRFRAQRIGATLDLGRGPGGGTLMRCVVPALVSSNATAHEAPSARSYQLALAALRSEPNASESAANKSPRP